MRVRPIPSRWAASTTLSRLSWRGRVVTELVRATYVGGQSFEVEAEPSLLEQSDRVGEVDDHRGGGIGFVDAN